MSHVPPASRRLSEASPAGFEMRDMFNPLMDMVSHLNAEEFIMLVLFIIPVSMGFVATLHVLTGVTKSELDAQQEDIESGDMGAVTAAIHKDMEDSSASVTASVSKVEQQIVELQRAHDTRFADLHKDLAGIVWELSKLRADMARWQALAQLGSRSSSSSKPPLASAKSSGAMLSGGGEGEAAASSNGGDKIGEAAGGARAWRGDD